MAKLENYHQCLVEAAERHRKGRLKLCPRGYCTAKAKFKVYPSAYANGYASQVCNGNKKDVLGEINNDYETDSSAQDSDLNRWFAEEWVNVCEKTPSGEYLSCGRSHADLNAQSYPYCRPLHKLKGTTVKSVNQLSESEISTMCREKRSITPGVDGQPTRVFLSRSLSANGQRGGTGHYKPNMQLADQYNPLRDQKRKVKLTSGETVMLYEPFPSEKANKKLAVYVEDEDGQIELVHFGHPDYEDFTIHRDEDRRKNYCARSGGIKCQGKECDLKSPNYWSRSVLWNC